MALLRSLSHRVFSPASIPFLAGISARLRSGAAADTAMASIRGPGGDGLDTAYSLGSREMSDAPQHVPVRPLPIARPTCAFTVDVEDWYQSSMDYDAPISDRVVRNVDRVCALLDECGVKGTFFIQGKVAEAFPGMLQQLLRLGHEIQSHGYSHRPLYGMDRKALAHELSMAVRTVEDACGVRVTAFRAPDFSILPQNLWALETLAEHGFEVDSSIFPIQTRRYGVPGWGFEPRHVSLGNGASIFEVPVAIGKLGPVTLPVAGGGYFRLMPLAVLDSAIRSILDAGRPVVIYCHPYEFCPEEMDEYRGRVPTFYRLHQSVGRGSLIRRFRHLLQALPFGRFDDVIAGWPGA